VIFPMVGLNSICRPTQWKTISTSQLLEDGFPVYGANGKIGFYSSYTHEHPTVMITCRGATCGNIHISDSKSYINGNAMAFDCIDEKLVDIKYLKYCLENRGFSDVISGSAQPQITRQGLSKVEIPLPSLLIQKQIAEILEKADQLRKDCQQMEQELNNLVQAVFIDMFGDPVSNPKGWVIETLSDLGEIKGGLQVTSKRSSNPIEVPYLRVANVYRDKLNLDVIKTIRVTQNEIEKTKLNFGDVLFVEGHGNPDEVGRSSVWKNEIPLCVHQNHLIRFRPSDRVLPDYISAYTNSSSGKRQLLGMSKTTSGLNTLSTSNVSSLKCLVPPLELQKKYIEIIESINDKRLLNEKIIYDHECTFNSLMQKAFRGELNLNNRAA